ncbi:MAG: glycosyltransferase family 4 protein [Alphaproteobacteria bacterium]
MKIYYLSGAKLPSQGPHSIHVMKMAQAFGKAGHDVTLFAQSIGAASEDLYEIYDTDPCFKLHLFSGINLPVLSNATQLLQLSKKMNYSARPDLLYGHDPLALTLFSNEAPIIFEVHEIPTQAAQHWAFSRLLKNGNLRAIITVSDVLKKEILRQYPQIDPEQIFVAHDGADLIDNLSSHEDDATLRGRKDALNIGYAGSLTPGKGIELINRIARLRPEYDFHIVGGSKKQIQRLETSDRMPNVYFYGHCEHADVPSYLKAFDICVAPYQHRALIKTGHNTSRWISPMKVFEYMAAKKPMICSKLQVIEEIVQHDYNALLLPASNENKWAEAIDMLAEKPDLVQKLTDNAHQSLKDHYTWDKRVEAIFDFYARHKSQATRWKAASS